MILSKSSFSSYHPPYSLGPPMFASRISLKKTSLFPLRHPRQLTSAGNKVRAGDEGQATVVAYGGEGLA
jgi:hypothetical protein